MQITKIIFVLPSLNGGGAERSAVITANSLAERGYSCIIYLFYNRGVYFNDVNNNVKVVIGKYYKSRIGRILALASYLRKTSPGFIIAYLSCFSVVVSKIIALVPSRLILSMQNPISSVLYDKEYFGDRLFMRTLVRLSLKIALRICDDITVISKGVGRDIISNIGISGKKISLIHNPVDMALLKLKMNEINEDAIFTNCRTNRIIAVGRLAKQKGYPALIHSIFYLVKKIPATLFILGVGDELRRLNELVGELNLKSNVLFMGFKNNPWKYIAHSDVFVLASEYEGFGNVIIEAMACGVPVVAVRSDGPEEIIQDEDSGLLINKGDPVALANGLYKVLSDDNLRNNLIVGGNKRVYDFDSNVIADKYEYIIKKNLRH